MIPSNTLHAAGCRSSLLSPQGHGGSGTPKPGSIARNVKSSNGGGAVFMFCDGHAEFIKQSIAVSRDPNMRRRWNADNEPRLTQ